jgi:hypothetical protein
LYYTKPCIATKKVTNTLTFYDSIYSKKYQKCIDQVNKQHLNPMQIKNATQSLAKIIVIINNNASHER